MFALTAVVSAYPRLTSRQHPVVRLFRQQAQGRDPEEGVLLDGAHLIAEALAAGIPVKTMLVSSEFIGRATGIDRAVVATAARTDARIYEVPPAVVAAASPVRSSSGIVALADWRPAAMESTFAPQPALAIGLVDVQDPGNAGAVIRSADGLGATGVIAVDRTAHPGGWKALRGSMGSTFRLPVARASHETLVAAARKSRLQVIATVAEEATPIDRVEFTRPSLVLLGNEGAGLSSSLTDQADVRLTIPMRRGVNSLNVAVTAALVLYEARRQRT